MKRIQFIITLMLITFLTPTLLSCSDDDEIIEDIRDQYVGTWNYEDVGNITLFSSGQSIGNIPLDSNGSLSITKSGENDLIINGKKFSINGSNITSDTESFTDTSDGFNIVGNITANGTLGSNIITIKESVTGTWNNSEGFSGNLSGSATRTLTK